jgi:hypothetical protein
MLWKHESLWQCVTQTTGCAVRTGFPSMENEVFPIRRKYHVWIAWCCLVAMPGGIKGRKEIFVGASHVRRELCLSVGSKKGYRSVLFYQHSLCLYLPNHTTSLLSLFPFLAKHRISFCNKKLSLLNLVLFILHPILIRISSKYSGILVSVISTYPLYSLTAQ